MEENTTNNPPPLLDTRKYSELLEKLSFVLKTISKKVGEASYIEELKKISSWSDGQLIAQINGYKEADLKNNPFFFKAVVDTILKRSAYMREE